MRAIRCAIYVFCFLTTVVSLGQSDPAFERGKEAYKNNEFQAAIDAWTPILESGKHSAALYYNLGNAHYKLSNIGPSIYYYEKALQLDPNDSDVLNNLAFAENARIDIIEPLPQTVFSRWLDTISGILSYDGWAILAVVAAFITVFFFLRYYFSYSERKKRLLFVSSLVGAFLMLSCIAMAFLVHSEVTNDHPAIVFAESVDVKNGPLLNSETAFIIHEGTKLQITDRDEEWVRIQLADGKDGWVPTYAVKEL